MHEIIIVDDGSTDDTVAIARGLGDDRIRLLSNERPGVSAARNLGARAATSTWLMFLDADDRLRPDAVATLTAGAKDAPLTRSSLPPQSQNTSPPTRISPSHPCCSI